MHNLLTARERLIVALDLPSVSTAQAVVERLGDEICFYKLGLELIYGGGFELASSLIASGKKVFLDLKLHDIPNTVTRATEQIAGLGATFLTVHAYPQTMAAALKGCGSSDLRLLAVTVLTSSEDADLTEAGYAMGVGDLVLRRARQALSIGIDGLILSAHEAASIRATIGGDLILVTPGIRLSGDLMGDQKRVMTPSRAIAAGADYLVVGRPVTQAKDPAAAAGAIIAEINAALASGSLPPSHDV